MKRTVKLISALLLCIILIPTLAACSQSDVPDGYQLIACEGDRFRLYVPTQWVDNSSSGVTSAYYSAVDNASVTVTVADDAGDMTLEEYWTVCNENYKNTLADYVAEDKTEKVVLGGKAAEKHVFAASVTMYSETEKKNVTAKYKFIQVFAINNGETYVLTFTAPEDTFATLRETFEGNASDEGIIPYFKFAEPYVSEDGDKEYSDKVTAPEGMKLASTDERAYRFFVPADWKINNRTDATAAYASDTDSSNVSVQMYMSSDNTETVEKHWERLKASYETMFESFTLLCDEKGEEIKMDGISARKYTYEVVSCGHTYKLVQAIVRKGDMFYTVTFTAPSAEAFDKHISDVEKMIENFDIR